MITIILSIIALLITIFVVYKLKFEKRFEWIDRTANAIDEEGKTYHILHYIDKHNEGIQSERFYELSLTIYIANKFIETKNRVHRRNLIKSLFK